MDEIASWLQVVALAAAFVAMLLKFMDDDERREKTLTQEELDEEWRNRM